MRIIQFKDVIPGSSYALLTSSFFRDQAVHIIIHYYRSWKKIYNKPLIKHFIHEPIDDGFYDHLSDCLTKQNFHHIHYNYPDFLRRLYGALRNNIIEINDFLTIQLLYELVECFQSEILPCHEHSKLKKFNLQDPFGPFIPHRDISYCQAYQTEWLNFLMNHKQYYKKMHYYTFEIPQPFILAFLYFAISGPQFDISYLNILKKVVLKAGVEPALIRACLNDIDILKNHYSEDIVNKIKNFLKTSFPKMQHCLPENIKKRNNDSMRFLALLYKIRTEIPSICEYFGGFYFILINIEALNQLQKIIHPSESIQPTPVLGPISTRMIRAYDEIPEMIKSKKRLSSGQQLLSYLFPYAQTLKQSSRPIEIRHPDIPHTPKPHGYHTHPFILSWHDLFHSWRSGCHYKALLRQCRTLFDEKAGLAQYPTIMSKMIWKLTDMDFGFSTFIREEENRLNITSQLEYYINIILWFFFSSSYHEDSILYMYHLLKPGSSLPTTFLSIDIRQLELYMKISYNSTIPQLHDNLIYLMQFQGLIREYLQNHPNAHFMEVYLFSLFEPKYSLNEDIISYFNTIGYENCFEWTKNDGIHFSTTWYPTIESFGLKKKVSDNEIALLHASLIARVKHDNQFHEGLKPF